MPGHCRFKRLGDQGALVLGNILIKRSRHLDALEPLRRAAAGSVAPRYAGILIVRGIAEAGLREHFPEAEERLQKLLSGESLSPSLLHEAEYLLVKLHWLEESWDNAAGKGRAFLKRWPRSGKRQEVFWIVAESLRWAGLIEQAHRAYETIWYDNPKSPWAKQARENILRIESSRSVRPRNLSAEKHYQFIRALRAAGMHEPALEYMESFLARHSGHQRMADTVFLKSMSLHALRKNLDCVETVKFMRLHYRSSKWLPDAIVYAIKALRRSNSTREIRSWVDFIVRAYPDHPKSYEALYNLGVYLKNVVDQEEALKVLRRLVQEAGSHKNVSDALWTIAWIHRGKGDTEAAVRVLEELLQRFPKSGYRKAALYWIARFVADRDKGRAIFLYQTCLKEFPHDYYGHKSQERLRALGARATQVGNGMRFPDIDRLTDPNRRASPHEGYLRAVHLNRVGLSEFAAKELLSVPGAENDPELQFALASLYSRAGDPWKAIDIVNKNFWEYVASGSRDPKLVPHEFWQIVYPYNYRVEIAEAIREAGLKGSGIDPYLVGALIRLESRFLPTAVSPVGAIGLMQLMPDTAKAIAEKRGLSPPTRAELFHYSTNIRYGVFYLAERVREFQGDWFPAICSYNAGPSPVHGWWKKRKPGQPLDEFIESSITYTATRFYIKRVLGDYRNYEWLYAQSE
ncbi:MAG: transglycosylase SLT domain-containing protein [Acidobacteriota bacterium]